MKIGSYAAGTSPYGLLDMAGNVYERAYWFETDKEIDPSVFPVMLKGGSWLTAHWANLRNVDRCAQPMAAAEGSVGFRTVIRDPATIKAVARELNADFALVGKVIQVRQESANRRHWVNFYQANMELINVETAEVVWSGIKEIKKVGS
ncbi:MAG: SUMF1/EgtB/PvdO family nonheme iron enzyme [Planctomycetes bacterium]|nr:SUMF1/EgtB/PvdO family nonheme iron enzyme [Planctomycetota bacterium]